MSRSRPSTLAAMRTLRPNGEAATSCAAINMATPSVFGVMRGSGCARRSGVAPPARRSDAAVSRDQPVIDEVDGLRTLALLVGLDVEGDALSFGQRLQPGPLDGGDVHEHVASAVVRLDEAVAALAIEELDRTAMAIGKLLSPWLLRRRPPRRGGSAGHSQTGKASAFTASVTPPAPTGGGTSKPAPVKLDQSGAVEKCAED